MRKATKKVKDLKPVDITKSKVVQYCFRKPDGCPNILPASKKKFCSATCRNLALTKQNKEDNQYAKYQPNFATTKLDEYLALCNARAEHDLIPTDKSYLVLQHAMLPTKVGYSKFLKVSTQSLTNWEEVHKEFATAMDRLAAEQKEYLINNGLSGQFNPKITALLLGVNHGMIEKKEVDNTHKMIGLIKHIYDGANQLEKENDRE